LLNRVIDTINHPEEDNHFDDILGQLLDYTKLHFHREEMLMDVCNYPHIENHKSIHELMIKQVKQKIKLLQSDELDADNLVEFFLNWLFDHIAHGDFAIACHCTGKEDLINEALESIPMDLSGS